MTPEGAVRSYLAGVSAVTALAGSRIYVEKLPQGVVPPAVRVQLISEAQSAHLRGGSQLKPSRVQVDAIAEESSGVDPYAVATVLADAIDAALMGQPPIVVADLELRIVERSSRIPIYDPDELRQLKIAQDYVVWSKPVS